MSVILSWFIFAPVKPAAHQADPDANSGVFHRQQKHSKPGVHTTWRHSVFSVTALTHPRPDRSWRIFDIMWPKNACWLAVASPPTLRLDAISRTSGINEHWLAFPDTKYQTSLILGVRLATPVNAHHTYTITWHPSSVSWARFVTAGAIDPS
jgi:hypothetical protein